MKIVETNPTEYLESVKSDFKEDLIMLDKVMEFIKERNSRNTFK